MLAGPKDKKARGLFEKRFAQFLKHRPKIFLTQGEKEYYIKQYDKARVESNIIIGAAERIVADLKKLKLKDPQIVLIGRSSRPVYATLRKASEEFGFKKDDIKLIELSGKGKNLTGIEGYLAFISYAKRIGIGESSKPVVFIDTASQFLKTPKRVVELLKKNNPKLRSYILNITYKTPSIGEISQNWPKPVGPAFGYRFEKDRPRPTYSTPPEIALPYLASWIFEQARVQAVNEWLEKRRQH
jgi:hypothetical protein